MPSCTIAVHPKTGKDLVGTYTWSSDAMQLSDNLKGVVSANASGYMTVFATYPNSGIFLCEENDSLQGKCNNALNGVVPSMTTNGILSFSLVNPPAIASQVVQMPTTGAPDGLFSIGMAAVMVTIFGLLLVATRHRD